MITKLISVCGIAAAFAVAFPASKTPQVSPWEKEVVYQVFPRSYYDSDGDRIGDFKGLTEKLGFIHSLGATTILLQPVFLSRVYHNYFADDFFKVDPKFGTNASFFDLVRAAHRRHIKVIMDMEVQYVSNKHPWYLAAQKDPNSPEGKCLFSMGEGFLGGGGVHSYTGLVIPIASIRTSQPLARKTIDQVFRFWAAPVGRPQDGVDGFRIDHMMDDLDGKHVDTNMLSGFWWPIEQSVKKLKPNTFFVAEQSEWNLGLDQFNKGRVDAVYAIPLHGAFVDVDKTTKKFQPSAAKIESAIRDEVGATPPGKSQLLVIEDHDVERYASVVNSDPALLRLGAVFLLTLKGTPSIYYGQELGMKGVQGHGGTDGNDIPVRLAYRWTATRSSPGTATWYANSGPWASTRYSADHDGISVAEESRDPNSLLNFYKKMIRLRETSPALSSGSETVVPTKSSSLVAYLRERGGHRVLVVLNLSGGAVTESFGGLGKSAKNVWSGAKASLNVALPGHGFEILEVR